MFKSVTPFLVLLLSLTFQLSLHASDKSPINPVGNLTMKQVLSLVRVQNIEVKRAIKDSQRERSLVQQASVYQNPEIELKTDSVETTAKISSIIVRGGKRKLQIKAAKQQKKVAELVDLAVLSRVKTRSKQLAVNVLKQQRLLFLEKERLNSRNHFFEEVKLKVQKGRLNSVEEKRARILVSQQLINIKKRERELVNAKNTLSLMWGFSEATFEVLEDPFFKLSPLKDRRFFKEKLSLNSDLRIRKNRIDSAEIDMEIEKSIKSQNILVSGGLKHEGDSNSLVVSAGIPIAVFNKNEGAIEASKQSFNLKKLDYEHSFLEAQKSLEQQYSNLEILVEEIEGLDKYIIPQVIEVFEAVEDGYLKGKYTYLDVLDSQNSLFEFKESYIETVADYHRTYY
jgi:outer membrane protein, heavy metal efflux system